MAKNNRTITYDAEKLKYLLCRICLRSDSLKNFNKFQHFEKLLFTQ